MSAPWFLTAGPHSCPYTCTNLCSPHEQGSAGSIPGSHRAAHTVTGPPPGPPSLSRGDNTHHCSIPIPPRLGASAPDPIPGAELCRPRKSCPLPLHPFFSTPSVSNSFSLPVMRGLHSKLQQDAFVGRQSEWGRQFGALSAAAPPDPCWGDI